MPVSFPQKHFALSEALPAVPGATFEIEEIVEPGDKTVMPLIWTGADPLVGLLSTED